jgi:hypothetical protein
MIHIIDAESQEKIPIPAKRVFETHKTLGHHKSPLPNLLHEIHPLQQKANRLALLIATSPISRSGAFLAYHSIFIPSIKYTLPQSFYTKKILDQAQASSIGYIISKCGYNRNTARELIYAPTEYAGAGFLPWFLLQGEGQIQQFIKHWRTDTIVSKTLKIALHWAQWQSGHPEPILYDPKTPLPYLECRWLKSLRDFLSTIHARIQIDSAPHYPPERSHDIYIMSYARENCRFSDHDLAIINYCRLYLHVTTVSELFDAEGGHIIPDLFACRREPWFDPETHVTLQNRPSQYQINTKWQRLCREWATSTGTLALSMNLGTWTSPGQSLRRRRQTYKIRDAYQTIYHWREGAYWKFRPLNGSRRTYTPLCSSSWIPTIECTPISVRENSDNTIIVCSQAINLERPSQPHIFETFEEYLEALPEWERSLLQGTRLLYSPYEIRHHMHQCNSDDSLLLVSDGSQQEHYLSFGWVFGTESGTIYAEHSGRGYGTATSHRAEAWGMLSATLFLHHCYHYTIGIDNDYPRRLAVVFCSDNSGLIQRISQRQSYTTSYPNSTLDPDWELVEQIHHTASLLPYSRISYEWVRGHQDINATDLTTAARYNIQADFLAGSYEHYLPTNTEWILPCERCRLVIDGSHVYSHYSQEIRHAYTKPLLFAYLTNRHQWPENTVQEIDWEVFRRAANHHNSPRTQLTKLVHDKLPTRYELAKSNPIQSPYCTHCGAKETFRHLLGCTHPTSKKFQSDTYTAIEDYLLKMGTPDNFREKFLSGLDISWQATLPDGTTARQALKSHHQSEIGWYLLLKGYLSTTWRQELTSMSENSRCKPVDVLAGITKILWNEQLKFWEAHQNAQHTPSTSPSTKSQEKLLEYKAQVRTLHAKRSKCLQAHQDQYFYEDVEAFLSSSTAYQMKLYLHHYEHAIDQSVKAAQQNPSRTIFTFPGYTRTPNRSREPRLPEHTNIINVNNSTGNRGPLLPHKHTRWKQVGNMINSVRNYFLPPPAP